MFSKTQNYLQPLAFRKTMNILIFVFQHIDEFDYDELQCELLKLM